ncbi:hypothetical protein [Priestia aryabhattai]|uniref:hypothetical protein n=1 Tax=Priestia aryabhattai TaxID=412384 RepID=UPI0015F3B50B|nr:hypothetical protein [Priestia aryabhattai]
MKKQDQMEAQLNDSNEMVLIESKTMRDQHVYREDVLLKVKAIPEMPNTLDVTLQMAANYYDVPLETVRTIVKRNRDEFNDYEEIRLLKGKALKEFKALVHDEPDIKSVPSLQLLNRRGLLRLGMLLTDSEVAKSVRNYLLNVEEISDKEQKLWAVEREISKRERRQLTDAIKDFYQGLLKKGFEYSTFTNLVYKTIFDMSAKQMKDMYELEKNDALRDFLTTEDLRKVVKAEKTISALILLGKDYNDIKEEMLGNKEKFQ